MLEHETWFCRYLRCYMFIASSIIETPVFLFQIRISWYHVGLLDKLYLKQVGQLVQCYCKRFNISVWMLLVTLQSDRISQIDWIWCYKTLNWMNWLKQLTQLTELARIWQIFSNLLDRSEEKMTHSCEVSFPVSRQRSGFLSAGLRYRHARWSTSTSCLLSAVEAECCGATHILASPLRPHFWRICWPSLVTCARVD